MVIWMVFSMVICTIMMGIYMIVSFKTSQNLLKLAPFECGFEPLTQMRRPFSVRFFILVVLFLVFDVETVLLFPCLAGVMMENSLLLYTSLTSFLLLLMVGLLYEWYNKMLDWEYLK